MNMEKIKTVLQLERFHHVGCVVRNLQQTIKNYERIGLGPFTKPVNLRAKNIFTKGHNGPAEFNVAEVELIPGMYLELIEVVDGETCHTDFLKEQGEGMQHLCFVTDEYDKVRKRAEALGIEVIFWIHEDFPDFGGRVRGVYLDTRDLVGTIIEVRETKPL